MGQVEPLLRLMRAEHIAGIIAFVWPPVVAASVTLFRWKRLRSRVAFLVVGVLACFGVQALLGQVGHQLFWEYFALRPVGPRVLRTGSSLDRHHCCA